MDLTGLSPAQPYIRRGSTVSQTDDQSILAGYQLTHTVYKVGVSSF